MLVLHPGLPKSGTSSIQEMFARNDHEVSRALGIETLGKDFLPGNGYPPVSEVMYETERMMAALDRVEYAPDRVYFLSCEGILSKRDLLAKLTAKFDRTKVVMTVRSPPLLAWSSYCFSGWILQRAEDALFLNVRTGLPGAMKRIEGTIVRTRDLFPGMALCPSEPADLEGRFTSLCFDATLPAGPASAGTGRRRMNQSIDMRAAAALGDAFARHEIRVEGPRRREAVELARRHFRFLDTTPPELPADLHAHMQELDVGSLTDAYRNFLRNGGCEEAIAEEAASQADKRLAQLRSLPPQSPASAAALRETAETIAATLSSVEMVRAQ